MVLYHFPVGGVVMSRNVRNVHHLPQYGWVPIVLTPREVAEGILLVPRRIALQAIADADAGLVLLGPGKGMGLIAHSKIYDYLGKNRQVLAMLPEADARDLIEGLGWGVVAVPDPASVAGAIEGLVILPPPNRPVDPMRIYDRAVLAGRLADALSAIAAVVHGWDGADR